jgi:AAA15 family ATPase/GTPase
LVDLLLRRVERNARPTAETFAPIMALLGTADTGIIDMRAEVEGEPNSAFDGQALRFGRIDFKHRSKKGGHGWLPLAAESAGTLALLEVGMKLIDVFSVGGLLLVDELESSLHPALARHIVALFQDPVQNPKRAQLVFTTHDTNLLGSVVGEPALRRDQVWLTEKDDAGATTLYPLTDYRPRKEENLERGYLQGRYGAIPYYGRSSTSRRGRPRRTGETCGAR